MTIVVYSDLESDCLVGAGRPDAAVFNGADVDTLVSTVTGPRGDAAGSEGPSGDA